MIGPSYAPDSRWGMFSQERITGCTIRCGLCGLRFASQVNKAAHLQREHRASVEATTVQGQGVYRWWRS